MPEDWYQFLFFGKKNKKQNKNKTTTTTTKKIQYLYNHRAVSITCHLFFYRFNYRSTHHLVSHGFYNFLNWFDERAWYPLGRIVGGTVSHVYLFFSFSLSSSLYAVNLRKGKNRDRKQNKQENAMTMAGKQST